MVTAHARTIGDVHRKVGFLPREAREGGLCSISIKPLCTCQVQSLAHHVHMRVFQPQLPISTPRIVAVVCWRFASAVVAESAALLLQEPSLCLAAVGRFANGFQEQTMIGALLHAHIVCVYMGCFRGFQALSFARTARSQVNGMLLVFVFGPSCSVMDLYFSSWFDARCDLHTPPACCWQWHGRDPCSCEGGFGLRRHVHAHVQLPQVSTHDARMDEILSQRRRWIECHASRRWKARPSHCTT